MVFSNLNIKLNMDHHYFQPKNIKVPVIQF